LYQSSINGSLAIVEPHFKKMARKLALVLIKFPKLALEIWLNLGAKLKGLMGDNGARIIIRSVQEHMMTKVNYSALPKKLQQVYSKVNHQKVFYNNYSERI